MLDPALAQRAIRERRCAPRTRGQMTTGNKDHVGGLPEANLAHLVLAQLLVLPPEQLSRRFRRCWKFLGGNGIGLVHAMIS